MVTGGFGAVCELFLHAQKESNDSRLSSLSSSSYVYIIQYSLAVTQDWIQKSLSIITNITDACLAGVLQDPRVERSLGLLSYLPWLLVNVFRSGGIFLDCASDFLKEQMVLFLNYQLARRG